MEKRRSPTEVGDSFTEASPADKKVHTLEAVPSQKRKPQRSPGHRKPGTRHQRRWPLTHRSCSAPPQAAARSRAASGCGVGSSPLGSRSGSSLRWVRGGSSDRTTDGGPTDCAGDARRARAAGVRVRALGR